MNTSDTPPEGPADASELVGTVFAYRYRIVNMASEGANTAIYDAHDDDTGRTVTLKIVRPRLAASPSFRERFDDTMRSVAALSHPNVAAVYDWGIAPIGERSTAYVVTERLTGGSLRDLFDRGRRLSPSQALVVGLDACRGLDYAHRRGFVHGELTPSKLVFGDDRRLRIVDFGLARLLTEKSWQQPDSVSNHVAWYASPEQGQSLPIDGKTDVYALCLSLHEAVTGNLPFKNDSTVAALAARQGKLMPVSADLGPLAAVFERAGRPEPDERSSAAEFGKGLLDVAPKLARPEPLPLLSTGLFETPVEQMRSPDDPTGGVTRPSAPLVVPIDEPGAGAADAATGDEELPPTEALDAMPEAAADGEGDDGLPPTEALDAMPDAAADGEGDDGLPPTEALDATPDATPDGAVADGVPEAPVIVEAEPDAEIPRPDAGDDLVILPLDSGIDESASDGEGGGERVATAAMPVTDREVRATQQLPAVPDAPAQRRGFPWKWVIALFVIAALAALGVVATRLFRTPVYEVPDLVDRPIAEARNLVAPYDWVVTEQTERSDEVSTVDHVVRTVPAAGVELAEGEPFLIVVSEGPVLRSLPDSTGLVASEAQTELVALGLTVEIVQEFDETVELDHVISWSVPGDETLTTGSQVPPGTAVQLVVSKGPAPRVVPDLVGQQVDAATASLAELRLTLAEDERVFSDDIPAGQIISQSTAPGTEVPRDTEIRIVASKGPDLVAFPDISGAANYEDAANILRQAGFEPVLVFGDTEGSVRSYTIDGAVPEVGQQFRRGTRVDFQAL